MIARLTRCWSDSGETFGLIQDPEGDFVTYDDHCAALAEKEREIEQLKHEVSVWRGGHNEEVRKKRAISEQFGKLCKAQRAMKLENAHLVKKADQLQADLDQLVGEAVWAMRIVLSDYPEGCFAWCRATEFLAGSLVQSWKARQTTYTNVYGRPPIFIKQASREAVDDVAATNLASEHQARQATAPSSLAADLHKGRLAEEEVI